MILVTGSTGLTGRHLLLRLLKEENPIRAMYRSEEKKEKTIAFLNSQNSDNSLNFQLLNWFSADITDIPALTTAYQDISTVYHCAGLVSFDVRDKKKLRKINIEGTANMVNLAIDFNVKKFCYMSSVAALGEELNGKLITEKSPRNKAKTYNYYEISKYGGEMEVWRASQEGLDVIIVNPAIIIGSGNWNSGSGQLFTKIAEGFPFKIPKISGFVSVKDVVNAMVLLMQSKVKNESFILTNQLLSFDEVTQKIAQALKTSPPKYPIKKWMLYVFWIWQSLGYVFGGKKDITLHSIRNFYKISNYNNSKIKRFIDFEYTSIENAIQTTAAEFLIEKKRD